MQHGGCFRFMQNDLLMIYGFTDTNRRCKTRKYKCITVSHVQ